MPFEAIFIGLVIGTVAGTFAGIIVKGGGFELLGDIVVGILGVFASGKFGAEGHRVRCHG